jgi:hypothetical protein
VEPALEQLDVGQDTLIEGNGHVVGCRVGVDDVFEFGRSGRGAEGRRELQELIDRRRLVFLFRKAVAGGQRTHFVGADAIDQPVEVLADPRLGPCAVRRFEQHVDRAVEFLLRTLEVPLLELRLTGLEMAIGCADQRLDRVIRGRSGYEGGGLNDGRRGLDDGSADFGGKSLRMNARPARRRERKQYKN